MNKYEKMLNIAGLLDYIDMPVSNYLIMAKIAKNAEELLEEFSDNEVLTLIKEKAGYIVNNQNVPFTEELQETALHQVISLLFDNENMFKEEDILIQAIAKEMGLEVVDLSKGD